MRRMVVEGLEPRTLLATLPTPIIQSPQNISSSRGDESAPSIAVSPSDPLKMVAVWTRRDTRIAAPGTQVFTEGAFSTNGGVTWQSLGISTTPLFDPTTSGTGRARYAQITDAQVGIDRDNNVYVMNVHRSAPDGNGVSATGAITLSKWSFSGGSPSSVFSNRVTYQWVANDPAVMPALAVDGTVAQFTDPDVGSATQSNPYAGNVYIAWASVDNAPSLADAGSYNPNRIRLISSSDGGSTFSGIASVSDGGNFGTQRNTAPRLTVSQGTLDGQVAGGQVTLVWDDFGTGAQAAIPFDVIWSDRVADGAVSRTFSAGQTVLQDSNTTSIPIAVNISDARFLTSTDVDVQLAVTHPNLDQLTVRLVPPVGSSLPTITLVSAGTLGGANLGISAGGDFIGTTFDDQATRNIFDVNNGGTNANANPYIGHYRPLFGSLAQLAGQPASVLNGQWTLEVVDNTVNAGAVQRLEFADLTITSGLTPGADAQVGTTVVRTANVGGTGTVAVAASPIAVAPMPVIASDNTLGAFSEFQGRLYVAYTSRINVTTNPADNTDIVLFTSDNGGLSWQSQGTVNDDWGPSDGFSESVITSASGANAGGRVMGRPQFLPSLAVDQSTGALAISYFDTRNDAARARVANYVATSIDGGSSFGPQTYLNQRQTATDAITGQQVVIGPVPDNQSGGNGQREATFGFGRQQGLAFSAGRLVGAWSSNENFAGVNNDGANGAALLDIRIARATVAAGPRVVGSTMGPVNGARAADGTPIANGFEVTFDRPIDPATFTTDDVWVFYNDPTNVAGAGVPVPVLGVSPADGTNTRFRINFQPSTGVGTYSYAIGSDIRDRIRSAVTSFSNVGPRQNIASTDVPKAIPDLTTISSIVTVNNPALNGLVVADLDVTLNLTHTFDADLILTLITPSGRRIILSNRNGGGGENYTNTTFDDGAATSITVGVAPFTGTFQPNESLAQARGEAVNGTWRLEVADVVGIDDGTLLSWSISVQPGVVLSNVTPGNLMDQDGDASTGEQGGDFYAAPRPTGGVQIDGFGDPVLVGPYDPLTLPLIVPGPYVVSSTVPGRADTLDNLALNSKVNALDVTFDRAMRVGTFTPSDVVRILGREGLVNPASITVRPAFNATNGTQAIPDNGTSLASPLSIPNDGGAFTVSDLNVRLNVSHANVSQLRIVLVAPDGTRVTLVDPGSASGLAFEDTTFDDQATATLATAPPPFTGYVRPTGSLASLVGKGLQGTWFLEVTDTQTGGVGTLNSWSIEATPQSVTHSVLARTFRVGFPTQQLSGTYTVTLGPDILAANGTAVDQNQNAGVDALFDRVTGPTATVTVNSTPGSLALEDQKTTTATITVTDEFVIQDLNLRLNILHSRVPDLTAVLVTPDGTRITLFDKVGNSGTRANFSNTVLDDSASTPIQNGPPPFFGSYNPQQPLSQLVGKQAAGTYTLEITDSVAGVSGTLVDWSLIFQRAVPSSGLGEPNADRVPLDFRIFTMDPTDPLSSSTWTAVGPGSTNGNTSSSRIGALAIDPSDPTGNTFYAAGARGGVWRTNNFLTNEADGPTWIPLADEVATFGLNMGGIAVFGRNNDVNQSIVIAATGDGDGGNPGVGFLRSMDGGATWTLLDSTNNTVASANRDRRFVGNTSFKVLVDPRPTTDGKVIIYAAMSGANGGLWRSLDTGDTWQLMRAGQAVDIVLDENSGTGSPGGNLQIIYTAFRGEGVFFSPNRGQVNNLLTGGVGVPLIQDGEVATRPPIPVTAPADTPNGAKGRIVLAKPALTGNPVQDLQYQGWLYAAVSTPAGTLNGLYLTKDFGQNWTRVRMPVRAVPDVPNYPLPSNDVSITGDANVLGSQGNYDITLVVDPNNPNVVFLGGQALQSTFGSPTGLARVDVTLLSDPRSLVPYEYDDPDGGALARANNTSSRVTLKRPTGDNSAPPAPFINLLRNPAAPFVSNATIRVTNTASFVNDGDGAKWTPYDQQTGVLGGSVDQHKILAFRDPLTGRSRLVFGDDQGIYTALDRGNGTLLGSVGTVAFPNGSRSGNIQISEFYYGAVQPSDLAAQLAGALFYGQAQDNGFPRSSSDVLTSGNITWSGSFGDGTGVATDQTGSGTAYQYDWPCCGGDVTNFFRVDSPDFDPSNGIGRTFGLVQASNAGQVPDPQWPYLGGFTFAVNPINGNQIMIGSNAGRLFATETQGLFWSVIAEPGALDGTVVTAPAYGAPDPNGPGGIGNLNNFLYAGTAGGRIFVTETGGGSAGNQWRNVSAGLSGGSVRMIVPNPTRGSHEAYAVTDGGVFHIADVLAPNATWRNITTNLFQITVDPFGDSAQRRTRLSSLTSLQVDWRYVLPDNPASPPANPSDPSATHPMLYVAGQGGIFRSFDDGGSWSLFPSPEPNSVETTPTPPGAGGGFPHAALVTDLDMALGNVNPTTGRAEARVVVSDPDGIPNSGDESVATSPNLLVASTFGRGTFAVRLAPIVFANTLRLSPNQPAPGGSDSGTSTSDRITSVVTPVIEGYSAQTAFGNVVSIRVVDLTDPARPVDLPLTATTVTTDAAGRFSVQVAPGYFRTDGTTDGLKTIGIQATDQAGTRGNMALFTFTLDTRKPATPSAPDLVAASDSGLSSSDNYTNDNTPSFTVGGIEPNATVQLLRDGVLVKSVVADALGGTVTITDDAAPVADGTYIYTVVQVSLAGTPSDASGGLSITIDTVAPNAPSTPALLDADNTGSLADSITRNIQPRLTGTFTLQAYEAQPTTPKPFVQIINAANTSIGQVQATASGPYVVQPSSPLSDGAYVLRAQAIDLAGNTSVSPGSYTLTIQTTTPPPVTLRLDPASDSGLSDSDGVTNVLRPKFTGRVGSGGIVSGLTAELYDRSAGAPGTLLLTVPVQSDGRFDFQLTTDLMANLTTPYVFVARVFDIAANERLSNTLTVVIDTLPPSPAPSLALAPESNTGSKTDTVTSTRRPVLVGSVNTSGGANDQIQQVVVLGPTGKVEGTATPDSSGNFRLQLASDLVNGSIALRTRASDLAGNVVTSSTAALTLTIVTTIDDYGADGLSDLSLFRPVSTTAADWYLANNLTPPSGGAASIRFGTQTDVPLQGDFDGDGRIDVMVYRPSTAEWFIPGTGSGFQRVQFGWAGVDLPIPADYDGDGRTDFAVYRPLTAQWFVFTSSAGLQITAFGASNYDVPVPADYDGDGKADIAVFRPDSNRFGNGTPGAAQWFIRSSRDGTTTSRLYGAMNVDIPVPADYDGDGKADISVFRPTSDQVANSAHWFYSPSSGGPTVAQPIGLPNDIPVPADYDGDGKVDRAVFRELAAAVWSVLRSSDGQTVATSFGTTGDIPLPSPLRYRYRIPGTVLQYGPTNPRITPLGGSLAALGSTAVGGSASGGSLDFGSQSARLSSGTPAAGGTSSRRSSANDSDRPRTPVVVNDGTSVSNPSTAARRSARSDSWAAILLRRRMARLSDMGRG